MNSIKKQHQKKKKKRKPQNENKKWEKTRAEEWAKGVKRGHRQTEKGSRARRERLARKRRTRVGRDSHGGFGTRPQTGREGQWAQLWSLPESDRFTWWHICRSDSARLCNLPLKDLHGAADDTEGKDNTRTHTHAHTAGLQRVSGQFQAFIKCQAMTCFAVHCWQEGWNKTVWVSLGAHFRYLHFLSIYPFMPLYT